MTKIEQLEHKITILEARNNKLVNNLNRRQQIINKLIEENKSYKSVIVDVKEIAWKENEQLQDTVYSLRRKFVYAPFMSKLKNIILNKV